MAFKKKILVDFDGVLHSYTSGWKGIDVIPDPPVPTGFAFLRELVKDDRFEAMIYSSRSKEQAGIEAMRAWLLEHGLEPEVVEKIEFPTEKPAGWLTVDDRAFCFEGTFPSLDYLDGFKPWNKR